MQTHSKLVQICPNSKLISKLAQTCPKSVGSCGFRYVVLSWSGRGACFQKTTTLQRLIYFIQNPLPLLAMFFQNPLDNLHYYTIVINFSKQKLICNYISGILLHKVHSTNEILWNKIPVLIL